jgi:bifunctional UDP-N-acetylglucosamine pyrophosphorylase/glucosamine-1-phosphate N-acetyltransferase
MRAIVFAAGRGVRLEPLTANRPKHLIPVAGAPLIEHTLRALRGAGVDQVLVVVYHMGERIRGYLGNGSSLGLEIEYVDQGGVMGTGHALGMGESFVGKEPFLVVYGDLAVHPKVFGSLLASFGTGLCGIVAGVDMPDVREYGAMQITDGRLIGIVEKPKEGGPGTINGGIYLLSPRIFDFVAKTPRSVRGEFELTTTINMAIDGGEVFGVHHVGEDQWVDVGRPWNVLDANRMLMDAQIKESRLEGSVDKNAVIRGPAVVEAGAEILSGAYLEGPVWVSSGCKVGPNCYIRPYTYLCRGSRVGNACEVKASILMEGVHVGHLSYLGDSVVGVGSNLGAGTITANLRFDDSPVKVNVKGEMVDTHRRKLGAFLGDGVKTGINVSLFPGIKIGSDSWIGPHVAVSRDVPPMTLVTGKFELELRQRR